MLPIQSRGGRGWGSRYAMAVGLVTVTFLLRLWLEPVLGERAAFSLFLPAIIIASYFCGTGPCLLVIGCSLFAADWFFIEPRYSLWVARFPSWFDLLLNVTLGFTMCWYGHANRVARQKLQKSLEEARRLREEYQTLFELSAVGQAQVDAKTGHFIRVNSNFSHTIGYTPEELSGLTFIELTYPGDRKAIGEAAERLVKGEVRTIELEKRCQCKNGDIIETLVSAAVKRDSSGQPQQLIAAIHDITPLKHSEQALRRSQERLESLLEERTSELQRDLRRFEGFCSSIAHDLRAPLRAMHSFASLLDERYGKQIPKEGKAFTQRIADASSRMDRLLMDLLEYGRVSSAEFETESVNTEELVRELVQNIGRSSRGVAAEIQIRLPLPALRANARLLEQAIENLLTNALKFTGQTAKPRVRIRAEEHQHKGRICVEDNGPGIPREYQHLIFGLFQRLDESDPKSTGIGLAIVRTAVERMKGSVGVDSIPGGGSRFWIELPKS